MWPVVPERRSRSSRRSIRATPRGCHLELVLFCPDVLRRAYNIADQNSSTSAVAVPNNPEMWEKCVHIAADGKNDCGTASHACAGQSTLSSVADEWVYVPSGTCAKITGGS